MSFLNKKKVIYFSKMHGLGNDFMIVDCIQQKFFPSLNIIKFLSNRNTGVGFDQLLLVEKPDDLTYDFNYRIFNANGNEIGQCGNGARCLGLFILLKKLTNKKRICIKTMTCQMIINYLDSGKIKVNMNQPNFSFRETLSLQKHKDNNFSYQLLDENLICSLVSLGNPHCVIKVQNIKYAPVQILGEKMQRNNNFKNGINVGFMKIIDKNNINLRVYERDTGETQSCGSGACAAVSIGIAQKLLSTTVKVNLLGGHLIIKWKGIGHPLYMIGSATHVYDGYIYI